MLSQVQMKMIDIQTSLKKSTGQIEGLKREIQRSKLTDKEINILKPETPMFSSVGRMYIYISLKIIFLLKIIILGLY